MSNIEKYTPAQFVAGIRQESDLTPEQEAFLYGMAVGRISTKSKTDGTITRKEAERLVHIYNTMHEASREASAVNGKAVN